MIMIVIIIAKAEQPWTVNVKLMKQKPREGGKLKCFTK